MVYLSADTNSNRYGSQQEAWEEAWGTGACLTGALLPIPTAGTRDICYDGYEGVVDEYERYQTCHMMSYVPATWLERNPILLLMIAGGALIFGSVAYFYSRRKLKQR